MLEEKQREAERQARFVSLGISRDDIAALADILFRILEAEGVFEGSGCNSHEIFDIARQRLGYDTTMTKEAIKNLCVRELTELVACNVPESVHPREIIERCRLQKSASHGSYKGRVSTSDNARLRLGPYSYLSSNCTTSALTGEYRYQICANAPGH